MARMGLTGRAVIITNPRVNSLYGPRVEVSLEAAGIETLKRLSEPGVYQTLEERGQELTGGLAEIARLGAALGARVDTFFGVAGVGDLAVTCFCPEGRNRTCGERLGRGESLEEILDSMASVVEGVPTTRSVMELARNHNVEMPITVAVHDILFSGLSPRDAISALMRREPKRETVG